MINCDDNYIILEEEEFSEYKGKYRIIYYDAGYYGLQKCLENGWFTWVISPVPVREKYLGKEIIYELLNSIKEADDNYNGDYWNLSVYLADDSNFMEVITKGDGETLFEQLKELEEYERKQIEEYNEHYYLYFLLKLVIIINIILNITLFLSMIKWI